jgi:hypothetical protein
VSANGSSDAPQRALARLAEMSVDARACAIVGDSGGVLAKSGERDWAPRVAEIWEAAEALQGAPVTQVHVATAEGELFATRSGGLTAIALTGRYPLASLMFCDLRSALREAAG